ncbi:hypothetical protein OVA11_06490 [Caulobacter sp. SL161]|nr:hypothetical protein [Caulobacter sp. SL161]MCY1646732.1 hypothetical protein [Caulobacter sp. SL161]
MSSIRKMSRIIRPA